MKKVLMVGLIALAGCTAQTTSGYQHYLLPDMTQAKIATQADPLLQVEVELAPFLDVSGIVYQTSATEIVQAKQHLWAADIKQQIEAQMIERLRANQERYWAVELNPALNLTDSPKLIVKINKFNGSYSGEARVEGEWMLLNSTGTITKGGMFDQRVQLESEGYQALVVALSEGLDTAIKQISQQL